MTSVGCNHGANPTAWSTRITAINRYQGYPNVEAAGAPVEGRSGGGLFNAQGQLIGVCFAADPEGDEGLYASLASIHAKLDELQMSGVYQRPSGGASGASAAGPLAGAAAPGDSLALATADAPLAVRGQEPTPPASSFADNLPGPAQPLASAPQPASPLQRAGAPLSGLTPEEQATLEEIASRSAGAEVVCIIQPRTPGGRSEVIKLSGVSPAFVHALTAASTNVTAGATTSNATAAAQPTGSYTR